MSTKVQPPKSSRNSGKTDVIRRLRWIDAEKDRPKDGDKIITTSAVGLFWGIFKSLRSGVVLVEGKSFDEIWWEDVHEWIYYPDEC
jgi:hypothetical protein